MADLREVVRAPRDPREGMGAAPSARIESVRELRGRFPGAKLRACAVVRAEELDERAGARVHLALESLQVTGSFKVRGALVAASEHRARGAERVIAVSAGNHGVGLAYACRALGVRATVCVPRTAARAKMTKIEGYGAELRVLETDSYDDAERFAIDLAAREGVPFVSPYDDEDVVLGNGTSLGLEIARALGRVPDLVVAPFGGGGLATGLAWACAHEARSEARRVWGVESEASPSMSMSLARGAAVERLDALMDTVAEGLEGGITKSAFERARRAIAGVVVVSEPAIVQAMAFAMRSLGLVLEGSAAAALVPVLAGLPQDVRASGGDVVVVLTGRNVDDDRVRRVLSAC